MHTQLFVSYLDRLRDVFEQKTWQREFIANWLYFKFRWRKVREARALLELQELRQNSTTPSNATDA